MEIKRVNREEFWEESDREEFYAENYRLIRGRNGGIPEIRLAVNDDGYPIYRLGVKGKSVWTVGADYKQDMIRYWNTKLFKDF